MSPIKDRSVSTENERCAVPKQDHAFVGEILFKDIKRLALLKEKPKEFNWLLGQIERVMRKSAVVRCQFFYNSNVKQTINKITDHGLTLHQRFLRNI